MPTSRGKRFKRFKKWLEEQPPFDIVIDGANVPLQKNAGVRRHNMGPRVCSAVTVVAAPDILGPRLASTTRIEKEVCHEALLDAAPSFLWVGS